ncbi:hypothetical protein V2J09_000460 [Rumex salicifolius]
MDDCCAVCAEPLEWVAYGPCAHRDVCSTCVVRLRNVCGDRRCCICKTDCSSVFVTKALGDYTKSVDFSLLPADAREGQIRSYWYHEATQAYFDDNDQYKLIREMCTFSCSVCDKEGQKDHGTKRKVNFRNLEQLKGHLFHSHRLLMCRLCLEGRKAFICEQKLYTKAQLNQHISTGDSEVDGTGCERGGFMGHPMCEFCRTPFYCDNELYTHMSTEHYTCHMCQSYDPMHVFLMDYFIDKMHIRLNLSNTYLQEKSWSMHFRRDHYLCEDEECLGKKFIVFQSEAELKRHNTLEHGGRMSRSKRNAALQIPSSFNYGRTNESGARLRRGRNFYQQSSHDNQLSLAIQASLETANAESRRLNPPSSSSSIPQQAPDDEDTSLIIGPFESLAASDSEPSSMYMQPVSHNYLHASLGDSSFPPLSATPGNSQQNRDSLPENTMAARLRKRNSVKIINVAQAWPASDPGSAFPSSSSIQTRPTIKNVPASVSSSGQTSGHTSVSSSSQTSGHTSARTAIDNGLGWVGSSTARNPSMIGRVKLSTSASSLKEDGSFDPVFDFPPVSSAQTQRSGSSQAVKVKDKRTANKSLVERIRAALDHDHDTYAAFKDISLEFRRGSIDTLNYLDYVTQFGLLHLVPEMARLCPEPNKQKDLVEAYNSTMQRNGSQEMFWGNSSIQLKEKKSNNSKLGKGKKLVEVESNILVRRLQSSGNRHSEGEMEALEKDRYVTTKGKSKVSVNEESVQVGDSEVPSNRGGGKACGDGGGSKWGKKTSKFQSPAR